MKSLSLLSLTKLSPIKLPFSLSSQVKAPVCLPLETWNKRHFYRDITDEVHESAHLTNTAIKHFLTNQAIQFVPGYACYSVGCSQCRDCPHPKALDKSQPGPRVFINSTTGSFLCIQCLWTGNWTTFQNSIDAFKIPDDQEVQTTTGEKSPLPTEPRLSYAPAEEEFKLTTNIATLTEEEFEALNKLHAIQGLKKETLELFGVRVYSNKQDLFFPRHHVDKTLMCGFKKMVVRVKPAETVISEQIHPREGGVLGLFGWNLISAKAKEIVLVSSEFDAMIVYQHTSLPVVALPKGISVLPVEALPLLEQFSKVILWMNGGGNRAWQASKLFSRKLCEKRCFLVSPETAQTKPLSAYQSGQDIGGIISKAQPVSHKSIVTFGSFRQEVLNELSNLEEATGVRWHRFPMLNRILKGHRRGELTVLTGPTGAGKTTFLSEYSIDLCSQGLRTLWGSFEIKNSRLAKTMLNQFSRKSMQKHVDEFDMWADKFEQLALYFMAFHGQESMDNVLDAMLHAVYVHDIEHIVVDNLQFMMGSKTFKNMYDRIIRQDQMIEGFRRFATNHDCHVTLVIHPRKEAEEMELSAQSIYGGVKASQEADNIIILQNNRGKSGLLQGKKYIQVVKNRFDGELGIMPLFYDKASQSYVKKDAAKVNPATTKTPGKVQGKSHPLSVLPSLDLLLSEEQVMKFPTEEESSKELPLEERSVNN